MIIFGNRFKTKVVGNGEFFCPACQKERRYDRLEGRNYFALYFIALFPVGDATEIIECQSCGRSFNLDVLKQKLSRPQPDVARLLNTVRKRLESGYPVEYMIRDLTDDGLDRDVALNTVNIAVTEARKQCPDCRLTYAASMRACADCGRALVEVEA